ncbi:hypothetical protein DDE82_005719 [Stemphylium lycopersici]|uniref:Uncharacterized protein n=1 Tax=Stemphylium lycopersici TaxID=183478 RepID=A0A364N754_STELY|nr:hypothetical protein TW65_09373 [Stemphylium lycopersici]RAR02631.1 hypothetical protein DDE82_005719 [Stemphylium lycopersici]RAR13155.1 hypothetical protein DDE83_003540 [Stemphylium lycopersici]
MGTFLNSPNTPKPVHTFYHDDNRSSKHTGHKANLSGATMLDLLNGPEGSIAAAYESSNTRPRSSKSRRPSHTPSTKTQLRQTNRTLVEIVQNVQVELATQRQAMLDMQSRILQLESAVYGDTIEFAPRHTNRAHKKRSEIKEAEGAGRETQRWWDTSSHQPQKQQTLEPPRKIADFWKSPSRFSGFNFNFDLLETIPRPSSSHAPEVHNVPSRWAPSSEDQGDDNYEKQPKHNHSFHTPGNRRIPPRITRANTSDPTSSLYHDAVSDIKEHVIEFDKINIPTPPLLQSPPKTSRSRLATAYSRDDEITALPRIPPVLTPVVPEDTPRNHKGIRSLLIYKTFSRSSRAEAGERRSGSSMRR